MANNKVYADYLMHGRTKGSRNGISTTKGYTAVGLKAKGHWVNGHYVYYEDEARNRAFQQGKAETAGRNSAYENQAMVKRMENARKADVQDQKIYGKKIKGYTRLADISPYERQRLANKYLENNTQHQTAVNQHNAEVAGKNAALKYQQKQAAVKKAKEDGAKNDWQQQAAAKSSSARVHHDLFTGKIGAYRGKNIAGTGTATFYAPVQDQSYKNALANHYAKAASANQNAVNQAAAERAGREAALARQRKTSVRNAAAKGAQNNWQQQANAAAGKGRTYDKVTESGIHYDSDLGNGMQWRGSMSQKQKDARKALTSKTKAAKAESQLRNSRSDIGNAFADAKEDAKNAFKKLTSKFKKKKK